MKKLIIILLLVNAIFARPLKVLFVTDKFPYGPRQFINNQITGFIDEGVDVTILAYYGSLQTNCFDVDQYNLQQKTYYKTLPDHLRSFDIIYCQFGNMFDLYKDIRSGKVTGKLVVNFRGGDATGMFIKNPNYCDELFAKIDLALPVCEYFVDNLIKYGCPKERILVHKSGIDCDKFVFKPRLLKKNDLIKIVTIGRLCSMKGHEDAIKAIALLKKKYGNIRYDIIGFPLRNQIKYPEKLTKLIKKLNLEDTVFLRGRLPHKEIALALDQAHIFLLASITHNGDTEGIPNAIMEAFATGLPVVATRHGGIPELVTDNISGILVDEHDIQGINNGLSYLIDHPELWQAMAWCGNQKVQLNHNKNILNKFIIKEFKKMVGL